MNLSDWRRVEELVHSALERSPGERTTFVRDACGNDDGLRVEVESVLANASASDESLLRIGNLRVDLVGQTIGVYRVDALLGVGGMGEVYRARDTKLQRDVAIKVLPTVFMADPERRARFDREARILASLNHPHIGAIYGFEDIQDVSFLVLELIPGSTLADRIAQGLLSTRDALTIAAQIAEALAVAHERGIVHRDLKPANIAMTADGAVKVLDFGLAKLIHSTDVSALSTVATREGVIAGTPAYMSPEQARGLATDKRTDIWAFGCVLYEMLTGRHAFTGKTAVDTIGSILNREPDWAHLSHVPAGVIRLLRRCLEKDPKRRLHDIADAKLEIEDAVDAPATGADSAKTQRPRVKSLLALGVVTCGVVAMVVSWLATRTPEAARPVIRATLNLPADQELDTQPTASPLALSPDGRRVAYVARSEGRYQLYVRNLDAFDAKPLPGTEGARYPFFSPQGESVAFFAEGKLKRVSIVGGSPTLVCDATQSTRGGSWSSQGIIVFDAGGIGLMKVSASGGVPERVAINNADVEMRYLAWLHFLPDGRRLLVSTSPVPTWSDTNRIAILSVETGEWTTLGDGSQAQYIGSGHIVFHAPHVREGELQTIEFDLATGTARGDPVSVLEGVFRSESNGGAYFAAAAGTLIFARGGQSRSLVRVDRVGRRTPITNDRRGFRFPRVSPDAHQIAVTVDPRPSQIWIYDVARGSGFRLATNGHHILPVWSPDGKRVAYAARNAIFSRVADGSAPEELLVQRDLGQYPASWTRDGRLVFNRSDARNRADIWIRPPTGEPFPLLATPAHEPHPVLSPDERWIAYASDETDRMEVYVRPFPLVNEAKWLVSTGGGMTPVWSPSGRELFYMSGQALMSVAVDGRGNTFRKGQPQRLFTGSFETGSPNFDVSPDGSYFVMVEADPDAKPTQLHTIHNFSEELKRR